MLFQANTVNIKMFLILCDVLACFNTSTMFYQITEVEF